MGITEKQLKVVQEQREGKRPFFAFGRVSEPKLNPEPSIFFRILLIIVILVNIVFNIALFVIAADNSKKSDSAIVKINELKQAISNNERSIGKLTALIKQENDGISKVSQKVSQLGLDLDKLKKNQNNQAAVIENLKKAEDVIFIRVGNLEGKNNESL